MALYISKVIFPSIMLYPLNPIMVKSIICGADAMVEPVGGRRPLVNVELGDVGGVGVIEGDCGTDVDSDVVENDGEGAKERFCLMTL